MDNFTEYTIKISDEGIKNLETIRILKDWGDKAEVIDRAITVLECIVKKEIKGYEVIFMPKKYNFREKLNKHPELLDLINNDEVLEWLKDLKMKN